MTTQFRKFFCADVFGLVIMLAAIPSFAATVTQVDKLLDTDPRTFDGFGFHLALDGDTLGISAIFDDTKGFNRGAVYIFTDNGSAWTFQAKLVDSANASINFSRGLALSGDSVLVSANTDGGNNNGAAFVFSRIGTAWTLQAKLTASDMSPGDQFGSGAALDGDTALIGSSGDDDNGSASGSAYIFERFGTTWVQQVKLKPSDGAANDRFGTEVVLEGDTAVISARQKDAGT